MSSGFVTFRTVSVTRPSAAKPCFNPKSANVVYSLSRVRTYVGCLSPLEACCFKVMTRKHSWSKSVVPAIVVHLARCWKKRNGSF